MRELKFRAWDKSDNNMYYNIQTGIRFDDGSIYTFEKFLGYQDCHDYHKWIVMQYTGLKDANGKEIYEGDIVEFFNGNTYKVAFEDGCFVLDGKRFWHGNNELYSYYNTIKIIGNIYENPELLK
jgi:uncharacterized phage protein (TIGR01671 family)